MVNMAMEKNMAMVMAMVMGNNEPYHFPESQDSYNKVILNNCKYRDLTVLLIVINVVFELNLKLKE